jgi:transcription antitermination factor NusG
VQFQKQASLQGVGGLYVLELQPRSSWFALFVRPNHEKNVSYVLEQKGIAHLLPLYRVRKKWSDRYKEVELPLFPGYVFGCFDPTRRVPVLNTPGVIDIVRNGSDLAAIAPSEITALQTLMKSGIPCQPWPYLEAGQLVEIESGPLSGLTGTVITVKNEMRLVLSVKLLHRSVLTELDRDWVRPTNRKLAASA